MTGPWGEEAPTEVVGVGSWRAAVIPGGLDDLVVDGAPVLRSVRVVVRDHDWRTVPVVAQTAETDGRTLRLAFRTGGVGVFDGVLTARDDDGVLTITAEVTALTGFRRNRIGIVVLHAPELAGLDLVNGDERTSFPETISPHQPVREVRELRWRAEGRANALAFTGEVFEMEDQRNWTDASYKTYGTSLALPFPVHVSPGDRVRQTVRITSVPDPGAPAPTPVPGTRAVIALAEGGHRMPQLAVGASTAPDADAPAMLPTLPVEAVLVELRAVDANWRAALARARRDAAGLPLDVRIVVGDVAQLGPVLDEVATGALVRLGVYDFASHVTEPGLARALADGAAARGIPASVLVGGTRAHFAELNRTHEGIADGLAGLTFSVTPQMHDRATRQIVESIGIQRLVARDARRFAGDRPVHVGPVTLRARTNFVATTPEVADPSADLRDGYGAARVDESTDPRQDAPAIEAWVIASVAALASVGVASVAFFEAWGPRGIHRDGAPSPAWRALERLGAFRGAELTTAAVSDGVAVLARREADGISALVASLRERPVTVVLHDGDHEVQLRLDPYAVGEIRGDRVVAS